MTNSLEAVSLNSSDFLLQLNAGRDLLALGKHEAAERHFSEATRLAPDSAPARFLYGLALGRRCEAQAHRPREK